MRKSFHCFQRSLTFVYNKYKIQTKTLHKTRNTKTLYKNQCVPCVHVIDQKFIVDRKTNFASMDRCNRRRIKMRGGSNKQRTADKSTKNEANRGS